MTAVLEKVGLVRCKHPEQRPRVVTREDVARAIAAGTRFGYKRALRFVDSLRDGVQTSLAHGKTLWYPSEQWLDANHKMLEAIAPDHTRSEPDSIHALLEDHVLDRSKGQLGLVHDFRSRDGLRHCAVAVITEQAPA